MPSGELRQFHNHKNAANPRIRGTDQNWDLTDHFHCGYKENNENKSHILYDICTSEKPAILTTVFYDLVCGPDPDF